MRDIDAVIQEFVKILQEAQWHIKFTTNDAPLLPPSLQQRYPAIPMEIATFLKRLARCTNRNETIWFLTRQEYATDGSDGERRWNELELISLQAAVESNDLVWQEEIQTFWNRHFPFLMAIDDYDYVAVDLSPEKYGQIVWGFAPEFEEITVIAPNFHAFLRLYVHAIQQGTSETLYSFIDDGYNDLVE